MQGLMKDQNYPLYLNIMEDLHFLWFVIPTLAIFLIWIITKPFLIDHLVQQQIPESL